MATKPTKVDTYKPVAKNVTNPRVAAAAAAKKAEDALKKKLASNKVKDLTATREKIAKKTGVWPNGMTN